MKALSQPWKFCFVTRFAIRPFALLPTKWFITTSLVLKLLLLNFSWISLETPFSKLQILVCCTVNVRLNILLNVHERFKPGAVVWRCSVKKVFLKILQNLQENTCSRLYTCAEACNFIKKETEAQRCLPVNFRKFLKPTFLYNNSGGCFYLMTLQPGQQHVNSLLIKYFQSFWLRNYDSVKHFC